MAVYMNNTPVKEIWWNGTKAKKVYYNNVLVLSSTFAFTYTGAYTTEGDLGGNFVIRFKTSGTLTITDTGGAGSLDVFLVGGGGGSPVPGSTWRSAGGGGGYTTTRSNLPIAAGVYQINVGAGGAGVDGGYTNFVRTANPPAAVAADGGKAGSKGRPRNGIAGGDGGSGGGSVGLSTGGNGGSDGSDGGSADETAGGKGQGSTTREFGEAAGTLYSGGGAGYAGENEYGSGGAGGGGGPATNGTANTGGGGGAPINQIVATYFTTGGSGIVCIRNHR